MSEITCGLVVAAQILVVEDNDDLRELFCELLASHDYSVAEARNGREAIDYLASQPLPSLVFLDLMMPVMDGMEFLAERRKDPRLAEVPVFIFTAKHSAVEDPPADVVGVFKKPLELDVVLAAVREMVPR
jgi:CheY-like chemotaxis protein